MCERDIRQMWPLRASSLPVSLLYYSAKLWRERDDARLQYDKRIAKKDSIKVTRTRALVQKSIGARPNIRACSQSQKKDIIGADTYLKLCK